MVYFLQPTDEGPAPVKIGHAVDVPRRVKQLERQYGRPLAVLATMPGGADEEREIHERFSHLRLGKTEQFQPDPELMEFIGTPLFVNASPVIQAMPDSDKVKPMVVQLRGSEEWKAWAEGLAEFDGLSIASVVDRAMRSYAKQIGYTKEPPKR